MNFLIDENIPLSTKVFLQDLGCEATHVRETNLRGASDREIALQAKNAKQILVTKDLDFGSSIHYPSGSHYGLLILRLPYFFTTKQILDSLNMFFESQTPDALVNTITILELGRFRRRPC